MARSSTLASVCVCVASCTVAVSAVLLTMKCLKFLDDVDHTRKKAEDALETIGPGLDQAKSMVEGISASVKDLQTSVSVVAEISNAVRQNPLQNLFKL
jgi:archaellum component FlaC